MVMKIQTQQSGFTLVETIALLIILAIIASVATPKLMSMIDDAERANMKKLAGILTSAAVSNVSICRANSADVQCRGTSVAAGGGATMTRCSDVFNLLADGEQLRKKYFVTAITIPAVGSWTAEIPEVSGFTPGNQTKMCGIAKKAMTAATTVPDPDFKFDPLATTADEQNYLRFELMAPPL